VQKTIRLEGHIAGERAQSDPYFYLPFEVPVGARRIHVAYSYTDPVANPTGPGNTLDIGIFDPRGRDFLTAPGFRGWSGAARREFEIAEGSATPGYLRGPLFPGKWEIVLGLPQLSWDGVRYSVDVTVDVGDQVSEADSPSSTSSFENLRTSGQAAGANTAAARPGEGRWLKGDLHCHTLHSDGANTVREIVEHAVSLGLDFLSVTDHNTVTHHEELTALSDLPIILIPGEEVTTYWGHANTWGLREWVDFRCADEASIKAVQRWLRERDAMLSINHAKCIGPPWLFPGWDGYACMEVWQAPWRFYNWESLEKWDGLLQRGDRVIAVGGSDVHSIPPAPPRQPHGLAEPTTWVYAEPTEAGVLAAIRAGHAFITDSPQRGSHLSLWADEDGDGRYEKIMGDTIGQKVVRFRVDCEGGQGRRLWIIADGEPIDIVELDRPESRTEFTLDMSGRKYVRAELRGYRGNPSRGEVVWAMTNPVWVAPA
jgi:hypothetical protein